VCLFKIILEFIFNQLVIIVSGMESKEKLIEAEKCKLLALDL
jgi:hypothetical protein